jgi:hypothetical protein
MGLPVREWCVSVRAEKDGLQAPGRESAGAAQQSLGRRVGARGSAAAADLQIGEVKMWIGRSGWLLDDGETILARIFGNGCG